MLSVWMEAAGAAAHDERGVERRHKWICGTEFSGFSAGIVVFIMKRRHSFIINIYIKIDAYNKYIKTCKNVVKIQLHVHKEYLEIKC